MPGNTLGKHPPHWVLDLHGTDTAALAGVRRWVSGLLGPLGEQHRDDVLLVVSELVANAYEHGAGPGCVRVTHLPRPCLVVVEVDDANPEPPVVREPGLRGRGMLIVDLLCEDWGVHADPETGGKSVWARIACEPEAF